MITYKLIRSRRKTTAIHITRDAVLEVRAPLHIPKADIDRFVVSKQKWITEHMSKMEQRLDKKTAFTIDYESAILLHGVEYPIIAKPGKRAGFNGECFYFPPGMSHDELKQATVQIYKAIAKNSLKARTAEYSAKMNLKPTAVRISSAKTRWGSCSGKNSITYSWRLIMAAEDVIDYVVVHELSHIQEHNHSDRFWSIVEGVLPDYQARKKKLKLLQERLATQDWD